MSQVIQELEESLTVVPSPPTISVGELQTESTNRDSDAEAFDVVTSVALAGSPQIVVSHEKQSRHRSRNQLAWIRVGGLACSLLVIGVFIFAQRFGQGEKRLASSGNTNQLVDAMDRPRGDRTKAEQDPRGNTNGMLPANGEDNVDRRSNRRQDNGGDRPKAISPDEDSRKAEAENGEQHPSGGTTNGIVPAGSENDPQKDDSQAKQSKHDDVDISDGKPKDWIGNTTWIGGFGLQGGPTFGPSANRQVQFNDNGREVSISESSTGITVAVDGRVVEAANPAELSKKDAHAFQLYEQVFGITDIEKVPAISAIDLQRMQWEELREKHSGNPQMKSLIERIMGDNRK
jgi:hypothetical protein